MGKKIGVITEATLLSDGWVKTDDPASPYKKVIENRNPINSTPEDSNISLIVHSYYNTPAFAVLLPDGGMLNFVANSMDELKKFEEALNFYDPPF